MTEYRPFPVGPAEPVQQYVQLPIDKNGRPKTTSKAWRTMIADAIARAPDQRSPAETAAVRRELATWSNNRIRLGKAGVHLAGQFEAGNPWGMAADGWIPLPYLASEAWETLQKKLLRRFPNAVLEVAQ